MRILVVEQNALLRQATDNFLDVLPGCETVAAASAEEALGLLPLFHPHLVLVDYGLCCPPAGSNLCRVLKTTTSPPLIVVMMPEDGADYRRACFQAGADACTAKASLGQELPLLLSRLGAGTAWQARRA
ncbi:MAG: response regulator [Pseudomonadota bacterium]|jgi:DNA-binding NarL/FixJ family response regulator